MENKDILPMMEGSIALCQCIIESLDKEKAHLLMFQTEALVENNTRQESLIEALIDKRSQLKTFLSKITDGGNHSLEKVLGKEMFEDYEKLVKKWDESWQVMHDMTAYNNQLIQYSDKNLKYLTDHLKKLLLESNQYNAKGRNKEKSTEAKVVEAKY